MDSLSPRLLSILSKIEPCTCLADIGSDHGYLIAQAVNTAVTQCGIAVELNRDPYERTRKTIRSKELEHLVDVRLGNGLEPIKVGEIDAVCIAGMGGGTIRGILEAGMEKLGSVNQLVLQPNVDARDLREFLLKNGFLVSDEALIMDSELIYQVIKAIPGTETDTYSDLELDYGRHILKEKGPLFNQLIFRDILHLRKIVIALGKGRGEAVEIKKQEVASRLMQLQELLGPVV